MAKENGGMSTSDVVSILTLALVIVTLILGLSGKFAEGGMAAEKADTQKVVAAPTQQAPNPTPTPAPAPTPTPAAPTSISVAQLEAGLKGTYVQGSADAKVSILEFSDFECPFCQRHHAQGTLDQVVEKYAGDVNVRFMHFPLSFHPTAQKAGEAYECAGDINGAEGAINFKKALFEKGGKPTLDVIETVAGEQGFDTTAFMECVNGGKFAEAVKAQMTFGRSVGVTGTPGNIVINNETGDFVKVSGAVPATSFDAAIAQYLQ